MKIQYRNENRTTECIEKDGVTYLSYRIFAGYPLKNAVSTRLGGVSNGYVSSMNMSFSRGDDPADVFENHRRFAKAVGYDEKKLVLSDQIHETRILRVEEKDAGAYILQKGVDGLMTDVPGLPLMTFYADCVPLLFYDTERRVIAMAHSGWRGTVEKIGKICLSRMEEEYGTKPPDVIAAIGPSICGSCYEVDAPLYDAFSKAFGDVCGSWFTPSEKEEHYQLDLAKACRWTLMQAGVREDRIAMPDLCTCCNPEFLFSHRKMGEKRGNLSVVMVLENPIPDLPEARPPHPAGNG